MRLCQVQLKVYSIGEREVGFLKKERKIWKAVPLAVSWSLWKMRNECVFNASIPYLVELCELMKIKIALWLKSDYKEVM